MGAILIIEDDEGTAQLMASVLRALGHELLLASNASIAYTLAQEHNLSLILLDMRLPSMDGWELAPILRNELGLRNIPIIAVSVQVGPDDPKRALQVGCDEYISKPFDINYLRNCVVHYLQNS